MLRPARFSPLRLGRACLLATPLLLGACHPGPAARPRALAKAAWVQASDAHAKVLLDVMARFVPERAASIGVEGIDEEVMDLNPGFTARYVAAMEAARDTLKARLSAERHPKVRQDLEILVQKATDDVEETRLEERTLLSAPDIVQTIFYSMRALLNAQIAPERRQRAARRLRRYAGLESGYRPLPLLALEYVRSRLPVPGLVMPLRARLQSTLANAEALYKGIGGLCARFDVDGCAAAHAALKPHLDAYHAFLRDALLPRARTDHRLPAPIYASRLRSYGVELPPKELASIARTAFAALQAEMQTLARRIQPDAADYRAVIRALKRQQVVGEAILPLYKRRIAELEGIVRAQNLVTLPTRPARIRLASEAESAALPAPNMRPPRLLGNTGERGTFVLPLRVPPPPGADPKKTLQLDDFTFEAASWTLTAHEARPGHEMQFASIIESGVSIARAVFAFNSTNVEGWGLYAEQIVFPFLPPEGQLIGLQHRLMRAARAYLDPELQLGTMTPEEALRILREDVVLSEAMARQEVERYTFRAPGQATSYFYGYTRLRALREEVERLLGARFVAREFHDHLLSLGLLPPALQRSAMLEWAQSRR